MRKTNEVVEVVDSVVQSAIASEEEITFYTVNKKEKQLSVMVEMRDREKNILKVDRIDFENIQDLETLTEVMIWTMIDNYKLL